MVARANYCFYGTCQENQGLMLSTLQREIAHLEGGGKQTPLSYKSSFAFFPNEVRQHHVKNTFLHQPVEYYREVRYDFAGIRITTTSLFLLFSLRCYLSNWVISSAIKLPKNSLDM